MTTEEIPVYTSEEILLISKEFRIFDSGRYDIYAVDVLEEYNDMIRKTFKISKDFHAVDILKTHVAEEKALCREVDENVIKTINIVYADLKNQENLIVDNKLKFMKRIFG